MKTEL